MSLFSSSLRPARILSVWRHKQLASGAWCQARRCKSELSIGAPSATDQEGRLDHDSRGAAWEGDDRQGNGSCRGDTVGLFCLSDLRRVSRSSKAGRGLTRLLAPNISQRTPLALAHAQAGGNVSLLLRRKCWCWSTLRILVPQKFSPSVRLKKEGALFFE
jgi:hypothetical protein